MPIDHIIPKGTVMLCRHCGNTKILTRDTVADGYGAGSVYLNCKCGRSKLRPA